MIKKRIMLYSAAITILFTACGGSKNQIKQTEEATSVAMVISETSTAPTKTTAVSEESKKDKSDEKSNGTGTKETKESKASSTTTRTEFKLTEKNKSFLQEMCRYLPEFTNPYNLKQSFWHDFLFLSYTGKGDQYELVTADRKDMGGKETQVKVSKADVQAYVKLVLGLAMPTYEPTVQERPDGQASMFYQNGFYYIGVSDFDDTTYQYKSTEIQKDDTISVIYQMSNPQGADLGKVEFLLLPETNENGFIVTAKMIKK